MNPLNLQVTIDEDDFDICYPIERHASYDCCEEEDLLPARGVTPVIFDEVDSIKFHSMTRVDSLIWLGRNGWGL